MMHLLVMITDKVEALPAILTRWREIGVPGTTILRSVGSFRAASWLERVGQSMLGGIFDADELSQRTLLCVIDDEELLEAAIAEAERLIGGFDQPKSGILFVLPVPRVVGFQKRRPPSGEQIIASAPQLDDAQARGRSAPIERALAGYRRMPALVRPDDTLTSVAMAMVEHPDMQVAGVINEENRLIGVIRLEALAADLFIEWMPEEALARLAGLDQALRYADQLKSRLAADVMDQPVSVRPTDSVREAFKRMRDARLPAILVADETNRVIGYVGLPELLALFIASGSSAVPSCAETP